MGGGTEPQVKALAVFDDGSGAGPALYVGGAFTHTLSDIVGPVFNNIARWDGASWTQLGAGVTGAGDVHALAVFDDGSGGGPALYVAGSFSMAGNVAVNSIARFDGKHWQPLVSGPNSCVIDSLAGLRRRERRRPGAVRGRIVRRHRRRARQLHCQVERIDLVGPRSGMTRTTGFGDVRSLTVADDGSGSGPALFAGGSFVTAGGVACNGIARWNGSAWSALDGGVNDRFLPYVNALVTFDDGSGSGPALHVGGRFDSVDGKPAGNIAKWGGCPVQLPAWTDLGYALPGSGGAPLLAGTGSPIAGGPVDLLLTHANPSSPAALFTGFASNPTPFKGGKLLPVAGVAHRVLHDQRRRAASTCPSTGPPGPAARIPAPLPVRHPGWRGGERRRAQQRAGVDHALTA